MHRKITTFFKRSFVFISGINMPFTGYIAAKATSSPLTHAVIQKSLSATIIALAAASLCTALIIGSIEAVHMSGKIRNTVIRISNEFAMPLWNFDNNMIDTLLENEINDPAVIRIEIADNSEHLLRGIYKNNGDSPRFYSSAKIEPEKLSLFTQKRIFSFSLNGRNFGNGTVIFSYWDSFLNMTLSTFSFIILILLITFILFFIIQKNLRENVIDPVLQLSDVVNMYSSNNFSNRPEIKTDDEIGILADTINQMADKIEKYNRRLEQMVEDRTRKLIDADKMAALGELVAGISHEINTPIGTALTAASYLEKRSESLSSQISEGNIMKSNLDNYLHQVDDGMNLVMSNLLKASELIQSFKKVAVDCSTQEKRPFKIKEYLNDIATSLKPRLKQNAHNVIIDADESLEMNSYPGDFSQVFSNLIMNSIVHGFENRKNGNITIKAHKEDNSIIFVFSDDGTGIPEENIDKIFNPFFTTKRGTGGSGLGLNIVYNTITQKMGGTIECQSTIGKGASFIITIPEK